MNEKHDDSHSAEVTTGGDVAAAAGEETPGAAAEAAGAEGRVDGAAPGRSGLHELSRVELENELEVARAEIERLQDQSLRRQAELINYRRRVQKELAESAARGQGRLLELLLPVIDDFERAVDHEAEDARAYHEGMQLILRSLQKVLEQIGVERIEPHGEAFDPRHHEAVARHETAEVPDGHVLDVYQAGYKLGERLIRPATVAVAFGGEDGTEEPAADPSADSDGAGEADDG